MNVINPINPINPQNPTTALFPGSFDPITRGHVRLIERAAALFPRLIVVVSYNPAKAGFLPPERRVELARESLAHLPTVAVERSERELLVAFARRAGARVVVRGLRDAADFRHEYDMAMMNRAMLPDLDTFFLIAEGDQRAISSSEVRVRHAAGEAIAHLVPPAVAAALASA